MRKHRSHEVVPVDDCLIAHPEATEPTPGVVVTERVVTAHGTREYAVAGDGFWQVHPGAPEVLVEAVLDLLRPQPGERALDLYAGVGLFAGFLLDAVGPAAWSSPSRATAPPAGTPAPTSAPGSGCCTATSTGCWRPTTPWPLDLVVLDPPREGARRPVVEQVVARTPRAVAYVACDPAALARDVAIFAEHGYRLTALRAFDLFPMTHHVECVALLEKTGSDLR